MLNEVNDNNKISTLLLSNYITKEDKEKISEMYDIKSENVIEEPIKIEPEMNICISKENSLKLIHVEPNEWQNRNYYLFSISRKL